MVTFRLLSWPPFVTERISKYCVAVLYQMMFVAVAIKARRGHLSRESPDRPGTSISTVELGRLGLSRRLFAVQQCRINSLYGTKSPFAIVAINAHVDHTRLPSPPSLPIYDDASSMHDALGNDLTPAHLSKDGLGFCLTFALWRHNARLSLSPRT